MGLPSNDRGRPVTRTAPRMSIATDTAMVPPASDIVRCTRCGHHLRADESVRLELGPACRRRLPRAEAA
jgi:hypothetical protein